MATDRETHKAILGAQLASNGDIENTAGDGKTVAKELWRRAAASTPLNDNATAGTAVAELGMFVCTRPMRLLAGKVVTPINVATNNSNYVTITVAKRTAGGAATTLCTFNTHGGAQSTAQEWNASSMALSATTANLDIVAGDVITVKAAKTGTGVAISGGTAGTPGGAGTVVFLDLEEI